jgi:hypothetical protein
MGGEKQTRAYHKRAGAIACGALLLAALDGAVPLAGQITPSSAGKAGDWTWMSGSSSASASGVYGTLGTANGATNVPGGREGATGWVDNSGNLWLLGGFGYAGNGIFGDLNDLWEFNPSTNYWTWMGGSNTLANNYCAASPMFGLLGDFGAGYVPGGRQSAASWTDKSGNLWLFGGDGVGAGTANACGTYSVGYLNDLWEFKPSLGAFGEWAWMGGSSAPNAFGMYPAAMYEYTSGVAPGAREYAATWTDNSGNFWLFGGFGYDANGYFGELNDLWQFNPSLNEWAWMGGSSTVPAYSGQPGVYGTQGTPAATNIPGGRYGASTWADSSGNLWLYGGLGVDGVGNSGNLNDLWEFNRSVGEYGEWVWMGGSSAISPSGWPGVYGTEGTPAAENIPGGRDEAVSWTDSSGHYWLFGGAGFFNDLWAFDPSTSQWVWMDGSSTANQFGSYGTLRSPASTNTPGGRYEATNWTDKDGNLWLFGGSGRAGGGTVDPLNDLWVYPPPPISFGGTAAATPVFSVASGTYITTQSVTISDATVGATIYYTTNGTTPTTGSSVFNSGNPITVSSTETLEAIATAPGDATSAVGTAVYTITPPAATPTFSPVAGTYPSTQMVTISDTTPGAMIFYTTNGTTPSFSGTVPNPGTTIYSGQITVSSTETINAIASANGYSPSPEATALYTIAALAPAQVMDNETITVIDTETFPDVADTELITVTDMEVVRAYNAITITPTPASFNANSENGYATHAYAPVTFTATGGIGTLTFAESGTLPTGVTFVNGVLSGTPTAAGGPYTFSVTATDADGDSIIVPGYLLTIYAASAYPAVVTDNETITVTDTETFPDVVDSETITVTDTEIVKTGPIITTTSPLPAGYVGVPYSTAFTASGGSGTGYTWSITSGGPALLAAGLSLSTAGVLSGTPTAAATYPVTVQVADSAGNTYSANFSLAVTALAPIANLSPAMLTFAPQTTGTKSAAQTVTLSNTGNAPLNITGTGISISGANAADYSQTNACGMSVAVSGDCMISVTFTPSLSTGAETATLNVMDNASGSLQQVQLLGNALPTPSVSCAIPTVTVSGNTATAQITCTATNYIGTIALACNLPSQFSAYTCSFSPSSLNFTSSTTQASTMLTIQYQSASLDRKSLPGTSGLVAFGAVFWLPAWVFVVRRKKAKSKPGLLLLLILLCGLVGTTSCGGKSGPPTAPPGTYQASVTLTGPGLNEIISFTIQVP